MAISINDQKNKIEEYIFNSKLINLLFSNIIIVSIIIVFITILILYFNKELNIVKLFIWLNITTTIILILHNRTIKLEFAEKNKIKGTEEFKSMMDNTTKELIVGQNELVEKDIIKFLN